MASAGQHEDSRDRAQTHLSQKFSSLLRDRTEQLISRIKPAQHSEARRKGVADFVTGLIVRCFAPLPVSACTFGSVPLKTYLPDGDIDLSIFTSEHSLRDTWAIKLQGKLEEEQKNPRAQYMIGEINVINAEVKLLKCLVDNIVVDISFNQIGGLCTLTFLESIDRRVDQDHFFKKSIILVKAWCYYESRVLGAHHGLISTYALETLVLYIFNCYHRQLSNPLEVLHRFLIEFSEFDWEHYCLSIQGPIPLASFPDFKVESTSELLEDPLLPEEEMSSIIEQYSSPQAISSSQKTFVVKSFNIMDQLLHTNNLGRSVSKANFLRIRRAFGHGAKTLAAIMEKDGEQAVEALDNFFRNAWNAQRPHRYARDAYVVPPDSRSPHSNQHNNHLQHHPFTRPHNSHQRPMTPGMSSSPEDPTLNPEDPTRPSFLSSNKATSAPPSVIDMPVVNTSVAAIASAAYDSNRHAAEDGSFQHAVLQPLNLHSVALPHSSDMLAHAAAWEALRQHTVHSAYAQQLHAQMGAEALQQDQQHVHQSLTLQQDQQHVHQSLTLQQAAWNAAWLAASGFNKPASQQVPETSTERTPTSDPLTEKDANEESSDAGLLASEASFADDSKGLASEASFAPALAVSNDSLDQEQNPAGLDPADLDPAGESVMDPGPVGILPPPPSSIPPLLLQVRPPEPAAPRPSVDLYHPSTSPTYSPRKSSLHASDPHDRPTGRSLQTSPKAVRTVATFIPLHQQGSGFLPPALQGMQYLLPHPHQGYLFCPQLLQHQHLQHQHLNFQPFVNNHGTSFKSGHQITDSLTQTSVMSHPANTMQPEMKQASASASGDNVGNAQASGDEGRDISEGLITLPAGIKDDNSHVEEAVGPRSTQEMEKSVTSPSGQPGQVMIPPAVIWQQADQLQLLEQGSLPLIFTPTSSIASYVRPPCISDSVGAVPSQTMAGVHQVVDPAMSDTGLLNLGPTAQQAAASSSGVPGSMMPQAPATELLTPPASTEFSGSFEHEDVDFPDVVTLNPDQSDLIASNREPSLSCQDVLLPSVALAEPVAEAAVQQPFALHEPHLIPGFGMYLSRDGMEHSLALLAGTSPPSRLPVNLPPPPPPALAHNIQHSPPSWSFPAAYQRLLQQQQQQQQQADARALNAYHNQNHQVQLQQHQQYQQQYQQYISDNALSTSPTASQQGRRSNASVSGQSDSSSLEMMLSRCSHPDSDTLAGDWERLTNSLHVARFCLTSAAPAAAAAAVAAASPMSPAPADPAVLVPSPSPDVSNLTHLAGSTENCADFSLTVLGSASPEQPPSTVHITPSLTADTTGHDQTEQCQTHLDSEESSTILHEAGKELSFSDCSSQTIDPGSAGDATAAAGLPAEAAATAALAMTSVTAAAAASNAANHVDPSPLPASGLVEARRLVDQQDPIKVVTGEMNSSLNPLIHDAPAGPLIHPYQVPALLSTPVNPDNTPRPVIFPPLHASDIESSVTAAAFVTSIPPPPPPPPPAGVLPFLGSKVPLNGSSTSSTSTSDGTALGRRPQAAVMSRSNSSAASFNHAPPRPARFVSMPPSTSGQGSHQQHLPPGTTSGSAGGNVNLDQQWQQQRHLKGPPFSRESMPIYLSGHQTGTHPGTGEHAGITRHLERVMSSDPPQRGQQLHPAMMALPPFGVGLMPYFMHMPMSAEAYNAAASNSVHQQQRQQQQAHHQLSAVMPQLHALQVPGGVMMMSPALPVMDLSGLNMATLAHLGMPLIPAAMGSMQAASSSAAVMWQQQQQSMSLMPMRAGSIPLSSSGSAPPSVDQTAALPSQAHMRRRGSSASGGGGGNSIEGTMSSNSGRISPSVSFTSSNGSAPPPHCPLVGSHDASGRFQQQQRRPVLPMPRSHPIQAQQTGSPYSTMPPPLPPQQYHQQPQQKQILLAANWEDAAPFHNTASPTAAPLLNLVPADTAASVASAASVVSRHPQSSGGHVLPPGAEMPLRRVSADVGGGTRIPANIESGLSTLPTGIASHQSLGGSKRLPAPPTAVAAVLSGADIERLAAQQAAAAATAGGLPAGLERIPPSNDDIQPGTTSQLHQRSRQNLSVLTSAPSADHHLGDHHATEVSLLPYSPGTAVAAGASPVLSGSQLLGSTAPHPVVSFTHMSVDSLTSRGGAATASSSSTLPHSANTARSFSLNHRADSSLAAAAATAGVTTSENALYIPAQAQQYLQQAPTASGLQTRQHRLTSETGLAQGRSDREAGTTRGDAQLLRKSAGGPEQQQQHVKKGAVFAGNTRHSGSTTVAGTVTVLPLSPGSTGSGSFSPQGALHQSDAGVGAQHKQQQQQHAMYQRRSHHAGDGNEGRAQRQAKDGLRRQRPTNVSGDVSFNSKEGGGLSNSRRHSMDHLIPSKAVESPLPLSDMSEFPALGCSIPAADTRDSNAAGRRGGRGGEESFTAPTTPTVTTPSSPASAISQVYSAGAAGGTL
ncbi:hypothetical protein CEUSTIGMA_g1351.t1 [Chlamydomonas eustigma]|uniref:PAP/OAS1 substrate-binding-related domain-containing protein n=1 Tax=Chlamydomonas eustigma TaxID=1157962 RepID=A0A250WSX6_9CHLO|nr:hypothetical protein CEUSTIGMA_g1351.t1 [Chlamydomonas eustigma]|eukprot:GAX73901.1 hypothetical protein CEUSTIGMA_g1351.t1 [Chlamydomonas eustigma]